MSSKTKIAHRHAGSDFPSLEKKSKEFFTKNSHVPRYFGLVAKNYWVPQGPVGLEIRFNDHFYVGLFGSGEEKIFDRNTLDAFYADFQFPEGFSKKFHLERAKEPIRITSSILFDSNTKALFDLTAEGNRKRFVETLLDIAEGIISGMKKRGLEIRTT